MANQDNLRADVNKPNVESGKTYVRETKTTDSSGGSLPFIVGGLVVAVGFVLWLVFGGNGPVATTETAPDTTNVTIEQPAAPADNTTNVTIDPVPEVADPVAPADRTETAPADDAEPTPAPAPAPAN